MTPNVNRRPASTPKPAGAQNKEPAWKPATAEQRRRFELGLQIADLCRQSGLPREEFKELLDRAIKGTVTLAQARQFLMDRNLVRSMGRLVAEQRKRRPL